MSGVEIAQTHRQFSPQVTVITVGTSIAFPNRDTVRHHVYSFSPVKTFELKLYAGVPAAPILFDKPGIAVLGCNIHDEMVAWVVVVDTPLFARSAPGGRAQIDGVPTGRCAHGGIRIARLALRTVGADHTRVGAACCERRKRRSAFFLDHQRATKVNGNTPWWQRSIGGRFILVSLALLLAIQLASFLALRTSLAEHAHRVLPDQLKAGDRLLQNLLDRRAQTLINGARLLAADYGFREAVSSNDTETIVSVLANHGARIGATETALLTSDFQLRATTVSHPTDLLPLVDRLAVQAAVSGQASALALRARRPYQAVLVPVKAPLVVGWVLMGFPLDQQLAADLKKLSALDLTLISRPTRLDAWSVNLTSLDATRAASLARQPWNDDIDDMGMTSLAVLGEEMGVHDKPLSLGQEDAAGASIRALLSLSVDDAVRLPSDLLFALVRSSRAARSH
jgi:hypothetical protein